MLILSIAGVAITLTAIAGFFLNRKKPSHGQAVMQHTVIAGSPYRVATLSNTSSEYRVLPPPARSAPPDPAMIRR